MASKRRRIILALLLIAVAIAIALSLAGKAFADRMNREGCAMNLRELGQACLLYANDHNGAYPNGLEELIGQSINAQTLICPASDDTPASQATTRQAIADLAKPGHCSYVYIGAGLTENSPPNAVVACERLQNHGNRGMNVLHRDGTVEWLDRKAAQAVIDAHGVANAR